jgi:hypothetical protein
MSDEKNRESIVDRVRKLKAQAESAETIGSENEAQAFAALMQRMMVEHKIREDELKTPEKKPEPIVENWSSGLASNDPSRPEKVRLRCRVEWIESLASVVARAHYCKILIGGAAAVCFVGRKSDSEAAVVAFELMIDAASAFGRKEYFKAYNEYVKGKAPWQRGFYRSYLLGFASRLRERYEEELGKIDVELKQKELDAARLKQIGGEVTEAPAGPSMALVRIAKDAFDAIDEHFSMRRKEGTLGTAKRIGVGVSNRDAYGRGRKAADGIKLRPDHKLGGGSTKLLK